jgi:hypothetical protein
MPWPTVWLTTTELARHMGLNNRAAPDAGNRFISSATTFSNITGLALGVLTGG